MNYRAIASIRDLDRHALALDLMGTATCPLVRAIWA